MRYRITHHMAAGLTLCTGIAFGFCLCAGVGQAKNHVTKVAMEAYNMRMQGRLDSALSLLERAIRADPTDAAAHMNWRGRRCKSCWETREINNRAWSGLERPSGPFEWRSHETPAMLSIPSLTDKLPYCKRIPP